MDLAQRTEQRETVGDNCRVGVLAIEARSPVQEIVKGFDKLRAAIRRAQLGNGFADDLQPIVMVVFISPAGNGQAIVFVLNETPEEIVQRAEWINLEIRQRVAFAWSTFVL